MNKLIRSFENKNVQIVTQSDSFMGTLFVPDNQDEWVGIKPLEDKDNPQPNMNTIYKRISDITTIITLDDENN